MGWAFVKRRMMAELGSGWQEKFAEFEHKPAAAASLGQVHRARALDGEPLACKLQYPDMQSAVEADLQQLDWLFAIHRRMDPVIDTTEIAKEIAARVREELDYRREAKHVALYRAMLDGIDLDPRAGRCGRSCRPDGCSPSTGSRAASCSRTRARRSSTATGIGHGDVHRLVVSVQPLWRDPRRSASRQLHGVRGGRRSRPASTCSTMAASASSRRSSSAAWSISTTACCDDDDDLVVHAYETWGFKGLSRETDRHPQHLGQVHLRPAARRPRAHHRGWREAVRIRPARGLPGASGR